MRRQATPGAVLVVPFLPSPLIAHSPIEVPLALIGDPLTFS